MPIGCLRLPLMRNCETVKVHTEVLQIATLISLVDESWYAQAKCSTETNAACILFRQRIHLPFRSLALSYARGSFLSRIAGVNCSGSTRSSSKAGLPH